jgi:predicted amidophosphoribosyltransferase
VLLPVTCPACGAPGATVCAACRAALRPPPSLPPPPAVDCCTAVLSYEGPARELVARLKYRNHRTTVAGLAAAMAATVSTVPDVVTWAPTTAGRRRARGFDHAELLARAVAASLGRPCRGLLRRAPGPPQTGRPLAERRTGPHLEVCTPPPPHVLVVDDVVTSGATATAAARALKRAGASTVDVVTAARTPPPGHRRTAQEHHSP